MNIHLDDSISAFSIILIMAIISYFVMIIKTISRIVRFITSLSVFTLSLLEIVLFFVIRVDIMNISHSLQ